MAIVPLPLPPGDEARAMLRELLEHGDIVGRDTAGRTIIQLAVDDWALEKLLSFDAEAADLEDEGEGEPDADDEEDGSPIVVELVRPKLERRKRSRPFGLPTEPWVRTATVQAPPSVSRAFPSTIQS